MRIPRAIHQLSWTALIAVSITAGPLRAQDTGGIKGRVTFQGEKPTPVVVEMASEAVCQAHHQGPIHAEKTVVGEGNTVQWAIVQIQGGLPAGYTAPAPSMPAVLDQQGCVYSPHVLAVQVDQELQIKNSDPVMHNVRGESKENPGFNHVMPMQGQVIPQKFAKAEKPFSLKCDVHPWMQSYVMVSAHPFFSVSDAQGNFEIFDLPAGEYEVSLWHEAFEAAPQKITVKAGETAEANFVVTVPGAAPAASPSPAGP